MSDAEEHKEAPWDDPDSIWRTEPAFWAWLRGMLRRGWSRYPLKNAFIRNNRFKAPIGRFNKDVWAGKCNICNKTHKQNDLQVDHLTPAGSLKNGEDIQAFVLRLFTTQAGMQWLCRPCHQVVTLAERKNMSFEEAKIEKRVIELCKLSGDKQKAWLHGRGVTDKNKTKNNGTRRDAIREELIKDTELQQDDS